MKNRPWNDPPLAAVVSDGRILCSLEEAALVLARQEYPSLETAPWLSRLDAIADRARPLLSQHPDDPEIIGVATDVLFHDLLFHGNNEHYDDPRNSFLNDVLERRTGIPISLAIVYMAVARRLGLTLWGTNFPGHFLVVLPRGDWPIVLDAFHSGRILSRDDCRLLASHGSSGWDPRWLEPVSEMAILRRMLQNLLNIYTASHDWERLLRTSAQILVVTPEDIQQYRLQGMALAGRGDTHEAIAALERYLQARPDASDAATVRDLVQQLRRSAGHS